ncbi:hypothetical protein ACZ75_21735 [Massilia sp. NR 4-1]|nr:hypothetical protein ACZ75_21735 [Massilia sp. NR 4-1]
MLVGNILRKISVNPAAQPALPHDAPAECRNCNAQVSGHYCHNCGQETRLHAPSFGEFAHEFIGHYVALEGRLWGSITRLLFRPGLLTNEYLRGRRKRYVEPLRLYLSLSIIFFAVLKFSSFAAVNFNDEDEKKDSIVALQGLSDDEVKKSKSNLNIGTRAASPGDGKIREYAPSIAERIDRFDKLSSEKKTDALSDGFYKYAPYAVFLMMPLFAFYLKVLYIGSGRRYGEHLLFALHTNAFAFIVFGILTLVSQDFVRFVLFCWLTGYLPWAMRRVYGGSRRATLLRWSGLMLLHLISLSIAIMVAMMAGASAAH